MINARRLFIAVMGAVMGAAGVEHGVGEFLQGGTVPDGIMIQSWPESPFFQSLSGEPALTILPDLRLTGGLAVFFSLLFAGWAIFAATRKHGGAVLMLLAVPMLLFGGGIFPPVLGACIGAAAVQRAPEPRQITGLRRWLGKAWRWIFLVCCVAWLALFPGVAVLDYFFAVNDTKITLTAMTAAFGSLILAYWSSIQHDRLASFNERNTSLPGPGLRWRSWASLLNPFNSNSAR